MSKGVFEDYAKYYDVFYKDKNYENELQNILKVLRRHNISFKDKKILEIGSGTGSYSRELFKLSHNLICLDISATMVSFAQKRYPHIHFRTGSLTKFNLKSPVDIAFSLFHVNSYLSCKEEMNESFKLISENLNYLGVYVFDVWVAGSMVYNKLETRKKIIREDNLVFSRISKPSHFIEQEIVEVKFDIEVYDGDKLTSTTTEIHRMKYWSIDTINILAETNGLKVIDTFDISTASRLTNDSWGATFILQKIK